MQSKNKKEGPATDHVNITLPKGLAEQARALGVNISFVTARAINDVIYKEMPICRRCRWIEVCIDPCCYSECPEMQKEGGCQCDEQGDATCRAIAGKTCTRYEVRTLINDPEVEKIKKMLG